MCLREGAVIGFSLLLVLVVLVVNEENQSVLLFSFSFNQIPVMKSIGTSIFTAHSLISFYVSYRSLALWNCYHLTHY